MATWVEAAASRHGPIGALVIATFGPIGLDPAKPDYAIFATTLTLGWNGASSRDAQPGLGAPLVLLHRLESPIFGGMSQATRTPTRAKLAGYVPERNEDLTDRIVLPAPGDDGGNTGAIGLRNALETTK